MGTDQASRATDAGGVALELAFQNAPVGFAIFDRDLRVLRINDHLSHLLHGTSTSENVGEKLRDFVPEIAAQIEPQLKRLFHGSKPVEFDVTGLAPAATAAERVWVAICYPLPNRDGEVHAVAAIFQDVTKRRSAEESRHKLHHAVQQSPDSIVSVDLRRSEARYRALFESSRDAIMTLAPPDWLFTSGNPATVKMFEAADEAEFMSVGPWAVSPERQPDGRLSSEKAPEMIATAMEEGSHFFEWSHQRLGGEVFPATILLTRVSIEGRQLLQATVRDITESKRVEEALRAAYDDLRDTQSALIQTEKLTAVGELAAGIAHELNQPLNAIRITAQSAVRDVEKGRYERDAILVDHRAIMGLVDKASLIIDHLRVYTRKPAGDVRQEVDADALVSAALSLLRQQLRSHGIRVVVSPGVDLPTTLGDPNQLEQVFLNLLINARDAILARMEEDPDHEGRLSLRSFVADGGEVCVEIEDNGTGVPKEIRGRIFDAFFTTKEVGKGTGLGLSIVHRILSDHGGRVAHSVAEGGGSVFRVTLPGVERHSVDPRS